MKKLSIVLLALLFVTGSVFAAFDISVGGEASASYEFDLDDDTLGYSFDDGDFDVNFDISIAAGEASSSGENGVYAILEGKASLSLSDLDYGAGDWYMEWDADDEEWVWKNTDPVSFASNVTDDPEWDFGKSPRFILDDSEITKFQVIAGDFTIDFLGFPKEFSAAKSFLDDDDFVKGGFSSGDGISVSYQDFTVGFNLGYDADFTYFLYAAWAGEVVAVDGLSAALAAGMEGAGDDFAGIDLKLGLDYEMDDMSVSLASDIAGIGGDFKIDAAANVALNLGAVSPVFDVYYAFNDYRTKWDLSAWEGPGAELFYDTENETLHVGKDGSGLDITDAATVADNVNDLWAQVSVADIDLGAAMLSAKVYGKTLFSSIVLGGSLDAALTDLPLEVGVFGDFGVEDADKHKFGGSLGYTFEGFKIAGEASWEADGDKIPMAFSVSNAALIDNAALKLGWASDDVNTESGAITASITVSF